MFKIIAAIIGCGILVSGCSTSKTVTTPATPEFRQAASKQYSDALEALSKGKKIELPPYPAKNQIPAESAACKNLKEARKRQMVISKVNINYISVTNVRPWAIFKYDVDTAGNPVNLRIMKSAGLPLSNHDFSESIKLWRFVPTGTVVKDCVAEMRIL